MATLNFEAKRALSRISNDDIIDDIKIDYYHISISFKSGITEHWMLRPSKVRKRHSVKFPRDNYISGNNLLLQSEYEVSPFSNDDYSDFFIMSKKHRAKFGFCDIRLAIHRLIKKLCDDGWHDLKYPDHVLFSDFENVQNCDLKRHQINIKRVALWPCGNQRLRFPGLSIIEQFLPIAYHSTSGYNTIVQSWSDPNTMWRIIDRLIKRKYDITRSNLVGTLLRRSLPTNLRTGPAIPYPSYYINLLNNISKYTEINSIADLSPKWGGKAIAANHLEMSYGYKPDKIFTQKAADGFSRILRSDVHKISNRNYDLIFLNDITPYDYDQAIEILQYKSLAQAALLLVHRDHFKKVMQYKKADKIIEVSTDLIGDGYSHHRALLYLQK